MRADRTIVFITDRKAIGNSEALIINFSGQGESLMSKRVVIETEDCVEEAIATCPVECIHWEED